MTTTTTPEPNLRLPVISISPYLFPSSSPASRLKTSTAIHQACRDIGFFYLRVDDFISKDEMKEVLQLGREFFARPEEEKMRIGLLENGDGARGYQKLHENITSGKTDHQEGLDFYHDSPYSSMTPPSSPGTSPLLFSGTNLWPINPPPLKPTYLDWVHRMKQLGLMVMKAMADGLGMSSNEWEELKALVDDTFWVMRLIGYPKLPKTNEGISCGAHKDYGCLTFLHADNTTNALQVFLRPTPVAGHPSLPESEGTWIDANPVDGCFVVNVGEMWEIWSNGLYKSTLHRVIHRSPTYRISLPFFFEPSFHAYVQPLTAAIRKQHEEGWVSETQSQKKYQGINYSDFLTSKVSKNFVVDKKIKERKRDVLKGMEIWNLM